MYSTSAVLEITKDFQIILNRPSPENSNYHAYVVDYLKQQHLPDDFFKRLILKQEYFKEGVEFIINCIIIDWVLKDDDGYAIPFNLTDARELLNNVHFGITIYKNILNFCTTEDPFK
ncbi:hypothetical protein JZM66_002060 [Salmonella enterica]|nr:hypothetical protein [Salmonella enterica]